MELWSTQYSEVSVLRNREYAESAKSAEELKNKITESKRANFVMMRLIFPKPIISLITFFKTTPINQWNDPNNCKNE